MSAQQQPIISIHEKLNNLRKLKEERERLTQEISNMRETMSATAVNQAGGARAPRINSWDRHQLSMAADPQTIADWVHEDFETFHQDKIENKLKTARARVLVNGIMSDAEAAYQDRVRALGVDSLESFQEAEQVIGTRRRSLKASRKNNPLAQPHTATKRIVLTNSNSTPVPSTLNYKPTLVGSNSSETPGPSHSKAHPGGWAYNRVSTVPKQVIQQMAKSRSAKRSRSNARTVTQTQEYELTDSEQEDVDGFSETSSCADTVLSSRAASVLGDDEKRVIISEFIDLAYARIIKIFKVYLIRAMYFDYLPPTQEEIAEIKDRLLGHLHIPRTKWRYRLPVKSQIEYLNITRDGRVELATAWVMRIAPFHLFVSHNMAGGGKGVKNKWRKLSPHYPVFHKITNNDINLECEFLDDESGVDNQSEFSEMLDMTDIETDPEYTSNGEEYDSD